jgi:nucleotide-binding universal stress UspA family protein
MVPIRNILVPTDFSAPAAEALNYAKALAAEFGSRLHLFNVIPTPQVGWAGEASAFSWPTLLADFEADARKQLERQIPATDPIAARVTLATEVGIPVDRILEYAVSNRIDLIVMGTHGRGLVGHMFLGSVAERVVRRSPVPVLTVHGAPPAAETTQSVKTDEREVHQVAGLVI